MKRSRNPRLCRGIVPCFTGPQRKKVLNIMKSHQAPDCELPPTAWAARCCLQLQPTLRCGHACTPLGKPWSGTRRWLSGSRWRTPNSQSPWRWWADQVPRELGQKTNKEYIFWVGQRNREPTNRHHCSSYKKDGASSHKKKQKRKKEFTSRLKRHAVE